MPLSDLLTRLLLHDEDALGLALLGLSACLEYIFPPFPGDTITLFGAFLATRRGWSVAHVFSSLMAGSAVGSMADYYAGRLIARRESRWHGRLARLRPRLDAAAARFARHGAAYLLLNRFLPSLRAFLFVAAGMARLPFAKVLVCGLISAAAWNGLLLLVGATVGNQWERLQALLRVYGEVAWAVLAVVVLALGARWLIRRRRAQARGEPRG